MQESVGATHIERERCYPIADLDRYWPPEGHELYLLFRGDWRQAL